MAKIQSARVSDVAKVSGFPHNFWNCFTLIWFSRYWRHVWQSNLDQNVL